MNKKDNTKLLTKINSFQKLLNENFVKLNKIREKLEEKDLVGVLDIEEQRKEEISKLDKEWEELRQIYHKNNSKKDKIILPILQTQQINRAKNFKMTKYERYLLNVKMIMKNMEINPIGPVKQKISIREFMKFSRKLDDEYTVVLLPSSSFIKKEQTSVSFPAFNENSMFDEISNKISYPISIINLKTKAVFNLNFKVDNEPDIDKKMVSFSFDMVLQNFNFHSLFDSILNYDVSTIKQSFGYQYNTKHVQNNFLEFLGQHKSISLQLSISSYNYFNQLTNGFKKKMDSQITISDAKVYFIKIFEIGKRFLNHSINNKEFFCNHCKQFLLTDSQNNIVYPVSNLGRDFYHEVCLNNMHRNNN